MGTASMELTRMRNDSPAYGSAEQQAYTHFQMSAILLTSFEMGLLDSIFRILAEGAASGVNCGPGGS